MKQLLGEEFEDQTYSITQNCDNISGATSFIYAIMQEERGKNTRMPSYLSQNYDRPKCFYIIPYTYVYDNNVTL